MVLGVVVGGAVGLALLFHLSIPGVPWLLALGLAKLTHVASA
jgi:NhaP-type Na+/H+ or K+/H+ antiporter